MGASSGSTVTVVGLCLVVLVLVSGVECDLTKDFYNVSCPRIFSIVKAEVQKAVAAEKRMAASLIRLHFHDCFVNGCDGSLLLDDNPPTFIGEKHSLANNNSVRGFDVIDTIKAQLEAACPATVSCADILAITSRDAAVEVGADGYDVLFGRRDSLTANISAANKFLPSPFSEYTTLVNLFAGFGLNEVDLIALTGAHTIGRARCGAVTPFLNDSNINAEYLENLEKACPPHGNISVLQNLDTRTPDKFDKNYYKDLQTGEVLLHSDRVLFSNQGSNVGIVNNFASSQSQFFHQYAISTVKMGNISPLTGTDGEIRLNCRLINSASPLYATE